MTSQACGREVSAGDSILLLPGLLTEKAFIKQIPLPRAQQVIPPHDVTYFGSRVKNKNAVYGAHNHKGVTLFFFVLLKSRL